jgi:hypothetical protein
VPGAGYFIALDESFRKWAAAMRAGVINSIEAAVNVKHGNPSPACFYKLRLSGGNFTGCSDFDELTHRFSSLAAVK